MTIEPVCCTGTSYTARSAELAHKLHEREHDAQYARGRRALPIRAELAVQHVAHALQDVTPHAWHAAASAAREGLRHADALSALPVLEELEAMRHAGEVVCVISADGASGYIVVRESNGARDLRQVFSTVPGRGDLLVSDAVRRAGADTLDCFDGYLPTLYARHGFREARRETNWTPGGPDVVYMARVPATVR